MNDKPARWGGSIIFAALLPHPPVLIPDIGGEELKAARASVLAMQRAAAWLNRRQPQSVVLISPHSPRRSCAFGLWASQRLRGDFSQFGAPQLQLELPNDRPLAMEIKSRAGLLGLQTWEIPAQALDHGALVPLWYLCEAGWKGPTVVISLNLPGEGGLNELGEAVAQAGARLGKRIAVIASGDMSHRLTPTAPAGYSPRGREFDQQLIQCLRGGLYPELERFDPQLQDLAGEDALDSVLVAVASANWDSTGHEVLSYEGPFGVGYGVAVLFDEPVSALRAENCASQTWGELLPGVAREALKGYLFEAIEQRPTAGPSSLNNPHGVFVTLRRSDKLRGCVGTLVPECKNVLEETRRVAYLSAFCDGRFPPVTGDELQQLRIEVSVVEPPQEIPSEAQLDPDRYGVIVRTADGREGCLLPDLAEIRTVRQQLDFARRKAGIAPGERAQLQRFLAPKFCEAEPPHAGGVMFRPVMQSNYEADWWAVLPDGRIECQLCPRACKLQEGQRGFCFVRQRLNNRMVLTTYGRSSGFWVDPVEKKPLNHFYPGSSVLSFGTVGCNLGCRFCQNWDISKARDADVSGLTGAPRKIAQAAKQLGCKAVAFTYNDPVIFAEYAMDVAEACHALGIQTIAVTAGFISPEPRDEFYRRMDAANVDLKGFSEEFYHKLCFGRLAPVLETLQYLRTQTNVWLEVTSLLIPGENDDDKQLHWAAEWFAEHLGPQVPWHFTAFHPDFKMLDKPPTPAATLAKARSIAMSKGIQYVYTGNVRDPDGNSTRCPQCQRLLILREGYDVRTWNLHAGCGGVCGQTVPGRFEERPGTWGPQRMPVELD